MINAEPTLRILRVGEERADDLAALHRHAFADAWDETAMRALLAHPGARALLAEREQQAIGFTFGRVAADEAEVLTLAVSPGHRRRGVGRALVRSLLKAMRGEGVVRVFLEVGALNAAAPAIYRGLGFVAVGRRPDYYHRAGAMSEDAVVMARSLAPPIVI